MTLKSLGGLNVKKAKKSTFFIVLVLILLFSVSSVLGLDYQFGDNCKPLINGVDDIRLGIDIQGGVDVTFGPANDVDATKEQLDAATATIKTINLALFIFCILSIFFLIDIKLISNAKILLFLYFSYLQRKNIIIFT